MRTVPFCKEINTDCTGTVFGHLQQNTNYVPSVCTKDAVVSKLDLVQLTISDEHSGRVAAMSEAQISLSKISLCGSHALRIKTPINHIFRILFPTPLNFALKGIIADLFSRYDVGYFTTLRLSGRIIEQGHEYS